jgi:transcriptional regulator with XRE-family HTH domain
VLHSPLVPPLKAVRVQKLLTQMELAERSGVSQGTIARIESGARKSVSIRTARSIAGVLGVEPAQIDEFRASLGLS